MDYTFINWLASVFYFLKSDRFKFAGDARIILKKEMKPSLKCTAAKIITKFKIPYCGMVPKNLETFIGLHGISKQCYSL